MKKLIPQSIKNIYHLFQAILANFIFGFPSRKIKVIGVTGTNGKTTVVQMVAKILEEEGFRIALASTINFKIGDKEQVNKTKFTTLSAFQIQKFIHQAVKAHCQYLILETSSHSLDQHRIWGIKYDVAAVTNVTREHLDYHKTMEEYRETKLKLFRKVETAVVNLDMEKPEDFLQFNNEEKYGYTASNQEPVIDNQKINFVQAKNIKLDKNKSIFTIRHSSFTINLPGSFNIENALAATCIGLSQGINLETIAKALEKIKGVPGRFEPVSNNRGIEIIIDYAVTPDSLEKLYALVTRQKKENSRIITVFGACGERDRGKRPIMGKIVSQYADYIILTNEDPYNEDPQRIIDELESGIIQYACQPAKRELEENYWKILNRREAIKKALQIAKPGDIVVVTGKGAEETMAIGKKIIPWNDKKVIVEELAALT